MRSATLRVALRALGFTWDAGWLWTYLIVYLPAMFLARKLLRVA